MWFTFHVILTFSLVSLKLKDYCDIKFLLLNYSNFGFPWLEFIQCLSYHLLIFYHLRALYKFNERLPEITEDSRFIQLLLCTNSQGNMALPQFLSVINTERWKSFKLEAKMTRQSVITEELLFSAPPSRIPAGLRLILDTYLRPLYGGILIWTSYHILDVLNSLRGWGDSIYVFFFIFDDI